MTPTNPKDPQAELRQAILKAFGVESDEQYVDNKAKFLIEDLLPVFQAHQQELLSELLGEAKEYEKWVGGNQATGRAITVRAVPVSVIERLQNKINDGGKT